MRDGEVDPVVVRDNMPVAGIAEVWPQTRDILERYGLSLSDVRALGEALRDRGKLESVLAELNAAVGSSGATCVEGG